MRGNVRHSNSSRKVSFNVFLTLRLPVFIRVLALREPSLSHVYLRHNCSRSRPAFLRTDAGDPNTVPNRTDGAKETGQPASRSLPGPSPTANLAGKWKGDPLESCLGGFHLIPSSRN